MNSTSLSPVPQKSLRKSVAAGSIGVLVHWFDWAVYAYMASIIAGVFFPAQDRTAGLLAVFAVFAISFGVRPLGAILFGYLGDRFGRKRTLSMVIISMSVATLSIGLLPGYDSIGLWAPALLLTARMVQGLAAGGEFGSAAAFLAEASPAKHRGFGVSWLEVGSLLGFLAASLTVLVLNSTLGPDAVAEWGWRIPFILTGPLGLIGFYIRNKVEDTPEFKALKELEHVAQSPLKEVFSNNWRQLLQTSGIEIMMNVTFYIILVYLLTYQEEFIGMSVETAALLSTVASITALILVPLFGALSDRIGRKPLMLASGALMVICSYPLFKLMQVDEPWAGMASTIGLGIILAIVLGVHAVTVAELFPTRTRQTGLSIAYSVTAAIFVGTVPLVLTWVISATGNIMAPAFYMILVGLLGLVTLLTMKETKGIDLLEQDRADALERGFMKLGTSDAAPEETSVTPTSLDPGMNDAMENDSSRRSARQPQV
ncbi:MFS transporter [Paeniglutamicibacter psychrophenolicus]|uniref:MFS transporter n=1 Tax=Paeniglutamicibacter psychrophenolicus TaxID=257454 RepID=UPI00278129ED|nr:MFS transporter [Paeniglutamicibacter psychrophenolicus]MDQ0092991.1 MHS family proline/betaine transporter-like MFS transporter [Paeniglutamicibacter psychrophenolicus]